MTKYKMKPIIKYIVDVNSRNVDLETCIGLAVTRFKLRDFEARVLRKLVNQTLTKAV